MKACVLIPVYNSEDHVIDVIRSVFHYIDHVIVVNDGSTDRTDELLRTNPSINERIVLVSYEKNRGKGYALQKGFQKAWSLGFTHAVTLDADGQHLASDIPVMLQKAEEYPKALIIGARKFDNPNMPEGNVFANKFSNFWFTAQTAIKLPDTQTGFRVYPLEKISKMRLSTTRYEAELELLVRCAWRNISLVSQPIDVYYPPADERLSHFRKGKDFFRISVLNTVLCFLAVIYGYPRMVLHKIID